MTRPLYHYKKHVLDGGIKVIRKEKLVEQAHREMKGRNLKQIINENMKVYNIRFFETEMKLLRKHFRSNGLSLSAGIRMVVSIYMKQEGLK